MVIEVMWLCGRGVREERGNKMIPCKDCLVLAACKHKREINCDLLANWSVKGQFVNKDYWKMVHSYLPKVTDIYHDGDRNHTDRWDRVRERK